METTLDETFLDTDSQSAVSDVTNGLESPPLFLLESMLEMFASDGMLTAPDATAPAPRARVMSPVMTLDAITVFIVIGF